MEYKLNTSTYARWQYLYDIFLAGTFICRGRNKKNLAGFTGPTQSQEKNEYYQNKKI